MFGPCFVMQYLVSFLVLQSSHWGRESWLDIACQGKPCKMYAYFDLSLTNHCQEIGRHILASEIQMKSCTLQHFITALGEGGGNPVGAQGVHLNPSLPPPPPFKLFHFHGIFKKNEIKSAKRTRYTFINMNPLFRYPGAVPAMFALFVKTK